MGGKTPTGVGVDVVWVRIERGVAAPFLWWVALWRLYKGRRGALGSGGNKVRGWV